MNLTAKRKLLGTESVRASCWATLSIATAVVTLLAMLTACDSPATIEDSKTLTIGIKTDQPDIGYKQSDGSYTGFDVDVATYIAQHLGFAPQDIIWKQVTSADRESYLDENKVQMVVASYTMDIGRTQKNGADIYFAGPYLIAHQDVLIRANEPSITSENGLEHETVCSVFGSTSAQRLMNHFGQTWSTLNLDLETSYSDCVNKLRAGLVGAVSTDNAILIGYAQTYKDPPLRVLGLDLSSEPYGIGLSAVNQGICPKINTILRTMISSGAWNKFLRVNFGAAASLVSQVPKIPNDCN